MNYKLPDLPYDYDALKPYIDKKTMRIHHGKHHAGYVKNLNAALEEHGDTQTTRFSGKLCHLRQLAKEVASQIVNC